MKRREAKALGLTTYVTGNPCPHGHINPARKTHNGCCVECDKPKAAQRAKKSNQRPEYFEWCEGYDFVGAVKRYKQTPKGRAAVANSNAKRRVREKAELSAEETQRVKDIYMERDRLNQEAGCIAYHVDHIHPLAKGGAHHPDNLQILTAEENLKKSDHYH